MLKLEIKLCDLIKILFFSLYISDKYSTFRSSADIATTPDSGISSASSMFEYPKVFNFNPKYTSQMQTFDNARKVCISCFNYF